MSKNIAYSEKTDLIFKAIFEIQQECPFIGKDSVNPHFKSKYASLEDIWSSLRPLFKRHGIMVSQVPGEVANGCVEVITSLVHVESGQFMLTRGLMPIGKDGPQAVGSAITYARRYFLAPMLGIVAGEDDDAETAEGRSAADLAALRKRKDEVIKAITNAVGKDAVPLFVSKALGRAVDDKVTLNNAAEIGVLEAAYNNLTTKKV